MNSYELRQAERKERLATRADRLQAEANGRFSRAHSIADGIPFGQPILVGHHSEKRHRADLARIDNNMAHIDLSREAGWPSQTISLKFSGKRTGLLSSKANFRIAGRLAHHRVLGRVLQLN